jgi:vaccinia related kinase
MIPTSIGFGIH